MKPEEFLVWIEGRTQTTLVIGITSRRPIDAAIEWARQEWYGNPFEAMTVCVEDRNGVVTRVGIDVEVKPQFSATELK